MTIKDGKIVVESDAVRFEHDERRLEPTHSLRPEKVWPKVAQAQALLLLLLKPAPKTLQGWLYVAAVGALLWVGWRTGLLGRALGTVFGLP